MRVLFSKLKHLMGCLEQFQGGCNLGTGSSMSGCVGRLFVFDGLSIFGWWSCGDWRWTWTMMKRRMDKLMWLMLWNFWFCFLGRARRINGLRNRKRLVMGLWFRFGRIDDMLCFGRGLVIDRLFVFCAGGCDVER